MSALAVETPAPVWAGRVVVRAAGRLELHVTVQGVTVPSTTMFTVPVECRPDEESAPGVRPWNGPVDENRLCTQCLRALRGGPQPDAARPAPARTPREQPEPVPAGRVHPLWAVPDFTGGRA